MGKMTNSEKKPIRKRVLKAGEKVVRLNLQSSTLKWLNANRVYYGEGNLESHAVEFYVDYCTNRKSFLFKILEVNFVICKHLLRVIGRSIKAR